jgi:hypothetical protein
VNRERLVSIEPVLKEFENLGILKIDAIEIKLLWSPVWSGLVVVFDNLFSRGLVIVVFKELLPIPDEADTADGEDLLKEGEYLGSR